MKIRIFTDGACSGNPGPGGWAAIFNTPKKCKTFSGNEIMTTNNRMELTAVIEAYKEIIKIGKKSIKYEIYSDSSYVVNSINNDWIGKWKKNNWMTSKKESIKNKDLWIDFVSLLDLVDYFDYDVKLIKVKGHDGNSFNEFADKIAKEESMKAKEGDYYD